MKTANKLICSKNQLSKGEDNFYILLRHVNLYLIRTITFILSAAFCKLTYFINSLP